MNSKQLRTLRAVFSDPTPANIDWADIEGLLLAAGCRIVEGDGSRVRFVFNTESAHFHRPHPDKTAKRYQVRDARAFLIRIGVKP